MIVFAPTAILLPLTFRWQNKQSKISGHSGALKFSVVLRALMISLRTGNVFVFGSCVLIFKMNRQKWEWVVADTWWDSLFHPVREENNYLLLLSMQFLFWLGMKICWESRTFLCWVWWPQKGNLESRAKIWVFSALQFILQYFFCIIATLHTYHLVIEWMDRSLLQLGTFCYLDMHIFDYLLYWVLNIYYLFSHSKGSDKNCFKSVEWFGF